MRGTFVPLYGLNNMFGQIPIVGLFLGGGSNEGLVGITYEVVGPPSKPRAAASIRSRRWRRACCASSSNSATTPDRDRALRRSGASRADRVQTGLSRTCRFLPSDSLMTPSGVSVRRRQHHLLVGDGGVVDLQAAALDLTARFAVRGDEAGLDEGGRARRGRRRVRRAAISIVGRVSASAPSSKVVRAVSAAASAAARPCTSAVASVASTFLASLISWPLQRGEPRDLVERQHGEQLEEARDVAVLGVAPELPVVVGADAGRR